MKITLDHDEFICLQKANRKPVPWDMGNISYHKIFVRLYNAGLLRKEPTQMAIDWTITKLGKLILKEHSPWLVRTKSSYI